MKKTFTVMALATVLAAPISADAIGFYAGVDTGIGSLYANDRTFNSHSYGAMFGFDLSFIRAEVEYNYLHGKKNAHNSDTHIGMVNAYIDLIPTPIISPYFGIGIGTFFGGEIESMDVKSAMAYQAMLGLQFSIPATPLFIDLEYRSLAAFDVLPKSADGTTFWQNEVRLKLRYAF